MSCNIVSSFCLDRWWNGIALTWLTAGIVLQLHRLSFRDVLPPASAAYISTAKHRARHKLSWYKMAEPHQIPWDFTDLWQLKLWPLLCLKSEAGFHWTQKNTLWDTLKPALCASKELNDSQDFLLSHVQAHIVHREQAGYTRHTDTEYAPWDVPGWRRVF